MNKKTGKARKWGIIFAVELLLIVILVPVIFIYAKLGQVQTATSAEVNKADIVINEDVSEDTTKSFQGYTNIALFGVDSREGELTTDSRSDSIIIVSINHDAKQIKMLSLYRDTCVQVPGYGLTKLNHAYAYGGAQLAMSTINTNLDLNITEFATVDFYVLSDIIDALGGLDLEITEAEMEQINHNLKEQNKYVEDGKESDPLEEYGTVHLNGMQATAYARIRKIDNDFKRSERQRIVLSAIFEKAKTANITSLLNAVDAVLPEVYTNLSSTDIIALAKDVASYEIVDSQGFPFQVLTGSLGDGVSYVFADGWDVNVTELHQYLFENSSYTPSSTVTTIGNTIYNSRYTQ